MRRATTLVGNVGALPGHNVGPASLGWWSAIGAMLIGAMGFALAIGAYVVLVPRVHGWRSATPALPLAAGTAFVTLALLSELPNAWVRHAARARRAEVRPGLVAMGALGVVLLVLRGFEFAAMNVRWDQDAYGSIVWALLLLHTVYLASAVFGGLVLAVLSWTGRNDDRRFGGASDRTLSWHFTVWSGVLVYVVLYWTPRWQ